MRTSLRCLTAVLVLAAVPACAGEPLRPEARATAGSPRHDAGVYMGSGLSASPGTTTGASADSAASRGSGYFGTGY